MFLRPGLQSLFCNAFRPILLLLVLSVAGAVCIQAQTNTQSDPKLVSQIDTKSIRRTEIELRNDNDMYLMNMQDQYYTNGLFLNLRKIVDSSKLKPTEKNRLIEFRLGHEIYNAYTAQIDSLEAVDRPIAGYVFASVGQQHFYNNEQYLSYSLSLGTIGKRAFGEQLQAGLHNLLNMYHAAGWEFQLQDAWVVDLALDHNLLLGRTRGQMLDVAMHSSVRLGMFQTNVKTGPVFRVGKLSAFDQSAHFNARLQSANLKPDKELYLYYKPEAQLVFYDASMQGGMFLKDKGPVTVMPKRWQISNHFGGVYANESITLKIQYFFNTKESTQSLFRHQYGSLSLAYRF
ncbi:MAG TPA: lipid A deacylase LpxR family protein [Sphingobacteriaceae bacterium]|nr:lipid A deacylase LpxR family protein [Sphingobacteriaceae bacterium]